MIFILNFELYTYQLKKKRIFVLRIYFLRKYTENSLSAGLIFSCIPWFFSILRSLGFNSYFLNSCIQFINLKNRHSNVRGISFLVAFFFSTQLHEMSTVDICIVILWQDLFPLVWNGHLLRCGWGKVNSHSSNTFVNNVS